jgi:prolyl-tRNA synthetase
MQNNLFQRALALREENTRRIDTLADFRAFFPKDEEKTISGGFALCHFTEGDETMKQILAELKVTPRCIPLEGDDEPGKCLFTGQPSRRRAVFAKAY